MPRGRPQGSRDSYKRTRRKREVVLENKRVGVTPLEYLVDLMNDESASLARRDRAAIAAARFISRVAQPEQLGQLSSAEAATRAVPADERWGSGY